jgi:hypothetical protein
MTPSCNIIGSSGVNANRPMPIATANDSMPAKAMAKGLGEFTLNLVVFASVNQRAFE